MTATAEDSRAAPLASAKLGEELPVFCERCGYSLHGLPQTRCEHCTLLQFHCPECGHHQPINTLRPAAQTILGRIRGGWLTLVILFKLNLFGWLLFAWVGMGAAWSVQYDMEASQRLQQQQGTQNWTPIWKSATVDWQSVLAFALFAWPCGMVWRMALLRWKRGWAVGLVLATLVMGCIALGATVRRLDFGNETTRIPDAYTLSFLTLMAIAYFAIVFGAATVWGVWSLLVHAFLPKRTANALLNWQASLSNQVSALARPEAQAISRRSE